MIRYDPAVRTLVLLNALLLAGVAVAVLVEEAVSRPESAIESSVRRYADAMGNSDLDGALAEIAPDQRPTWRDWIAGQLGNMYEVRGVAVRAPSLVDRLRGAANAPTDVTVVIDVDRAFPDEFYQATTRVPVQQSGQQWYLAVPLLSTP